MKKVLVMVERAKDGTYNVYCNDCPVFFGCGDTFDDAKNDMIETIRMTKEEVGKAKAAFWPKWLDEEYTFDYKFDIADFLKYYAGIITPTALGRLSGINPKQVWNYMHGVAKPRQKQIDKLQAGLRRLGEELTSITL